MRKYLYVLLAEIATFIPCTLKAQDLKELTVKSEIDSTYVFGFDLRESRSAKGGIWNVKTGKPETPLNYSQMKNDTIEGKPVILLYREVVLGNHPLNGWETWVFKDDRWILFDEVNMQTEMQHPLEEF